MNHYLDFAKELAPMAGEIMLKYFKIGVDFQSKSDNTHLTIADTSINDMVIQKVKENFPGHGILGEEASYANDDSEYVWVCDPIDGTKNFVFGVPLNVFSIVLCKNGVPQVGVVYDPYMKRLFSAEKGKGAYLGDLKLKVNDLTIDKAVIGCSGKRSSTVDSPSLHADIERTAHRMAFMHCVVYEGMLTSLGQWGGHVFAGDGAHDGVASALFVSEAGGRVTNLLGEEQRYDRPIKGVIASNGVVHDELLDLAKKHLLVNL